MSAVTRLSAAEPPRRLDLELLGAACLTAEQALDRGPDDRGALDGALAALHQALAGEMLLSAFVREHERLWLVAQRGYRIVPDGVPLERGVISRAVRTGETQYVPLVRDDRDYVVGSGDVVSELAIPLGNERPACAVLNVEAKVPLPAEAVAPLERFARAAAPVVERLRGAGAPDISTLARLFVHSSTLRDVGAIGEIAARTLARLLDLESAQVNLGVPGRRRTAAVWNAHEAALEPLSAAAVDALGRSLDRSAVCDVGDVERIAPTLAATTGVRTVAWLPLRASGVEIGVLVGCSRESIALDHERAELGALLAAHVAASIDAAAALMRERRAAVTDPLTGVLNRRGLDERLAEELARAAREEEPCSVVVLDGDDFKRVNDAGGHEVGDRVLIAMGRHLQNAKRSWDVAARLGGDEFVVVLPGAGGEAARGAAGRLRTGLRDALARAGQDLSVSVGIATYPSDGASPAELLRAADRAMYRAKEEGKDRTVSFGELLDEGDANAHPGATVLHLPLRALGSSAPSVQVRAAGDGVFGDVGALTASALAIGTEGSREDMLRAGARELVQLLGAAAAMVSRLEDGVLYDAAEYEVVPLATRPAQFAYDLADYPVTADVVHTGTPRGISLGDEDADAGEAFVLRELGMQAVLILPLVTEGRVWGIVEVYETRPRRFGTVDLGVAEFVVGQMGRLLESFDNTDAMERFYWETLASITSALEAKDACTSRHTEEVRALAVDLAAALGMRGGELRSIELGALLHDIGKIRVPEAILNKPGPLDDGEWEIMRAHPTVGAQILAPISPLRDVLPIVRSHHERWDGGGYPAGLEAEQIPLGARVIAVCDAWRAMNEPRPYRAPLAREDALEELRRHAGTQFDPAVVSIAVGLLAEQARFRRPFHRPPVAAGPDA